MMKTPFSLLSFATVLLLLMSSGWTGSQAQAAEAEDDGKLRIICFGAHPDDCELRAAGVGALWAKQGHHVKFVAVTNGDIGHWREAGGPLAQRRQAEVEKAAEILGTSVTVMDNHDGELEPTLENRKKITRLIREWNADLVIAHRPNDYHPDHRYTGILIQDAAFMVTVPFFCPETPALTKNPVFMYYEDRFEDPNPFTPDIVIDIDATIDQKLDALAVMESQFLEGGALGNENRTPKTSEERVQRIAQVRQSQDARFMRTAQKYRDQLIQWYGEEHGKDVKHAEAFQVCEYGSQPGEDQLKKLFPFFGE